MGTMDFPHLTRKKFPTCANADVEVHNFHIGPILARLPIMTAIIILLLYVVSIPVVTRVEDAFDGVKEAN